LSDLVATFRVEKKIQAGPGPDAVMVGALGTHVVVLLQIGLIEHGFTAGALDPQTFGNAAAIGRVGVLDFGGQ
jgi:hypothetical protein